MVVSKVKIVVVALSAGLFVTGMGLLIPAAFSPAVVKESPPPAASASETKGTSVRLDDFGDPLPDGALRRLGTLRFRHGGGDGSIDHLLLTPDGKTLVTNDYCGTRKVCVWELATGKLLHRLPGSYDEKNIALRSGPRRFPVKNGLFQAAKRLGIVADSFNRFLPPTRRSII